MHWIIFFIIALFSNRQKITCDNLDKMPEALSLCGAKVSALLCLFSICFVGNVMFRTLHIGCPFNNRLVIVVGCACVAFV